MVKNPSLAASLDLYANSSIILVAKPLKLMPCIYFFIYLINIYYFI